MTVDGLSSQNFHFSLDTTTIHVNLTGAEPVVETAETNEPTALEATEAAGNDTTEATPSDLAAAPASYWSLSHVVADALAPVIEAATADAASGDASAETVPTPANPHGEHVPAAEAAATEGAPVAAESIEADQAEAPSEAAADNTIPSLVTMALHHYASVDSLPAAEDAPAA
jgi:hypothetical protein